MEHRWCWDRNTKPSSTLIGVNVPWFHGAYGHDLGVNQAYPNWPVAYDSDRVEQLLSLLNGFGVQTIRTWLFESGEGLAYNWSGKVLGIDPTFMCNLEDLIRRIRAANMRVYWTLLDGNSVFYQDDGLTKSLLNNVRQASFFCDNALAPVLQIISEVCWAIDLCNEPEAIIAGSMGNGTDFGMRWCDIAPSLLAIAETVRRHLPGVPLGIGSGFQEHRNLEQGVYGRLGLDLDFLDYHTYLENGHVTSREELAIDSRICCILGEVGVDVLDRDRSSISSWRKAQQDLMRKIYKISVDQYDAAFLWCITDVNCGDATSLVFWQEEGLGLHSLRTLASKDLIRFA